MKRLLPIIAVMFFLVPASATAHGGLSWSGFQWSVYKSTGRLGQHWNPANVKVASDGDLIITKNGSGGGVGMRSSQVYGTWSVTYKIGGSAKYAILLNAAKGSRPEIDFAEGTPDGDNATKVTGTYHALPGCEKCIHAQTSTNMRVFHTFSITHTPSEYVLKEDGAVWQVFHESDSTPLQLHIQTGFGGGSATYDIEDVSMSG